MDQIIVHTDGASRGNPGPAAAGYVITNPSGVQLAAKAFFLGQATNNVAEYTAVVLALEDAHKKDARDITIISDSELVVRQLNGRYKVKSEKLRPLYRQVAQECK